MVFSCLCCCHSSQKSLFFICTNIINLLHLKESSERLVIVAKGFLKLPNLHMLIKQEPITSQKVGSRDFWRIANSVLSKGKSAIPPVFNGLKMLSSASDKAKLFAKIFFTNSNLDDSVSSVTPKMVRKVITNLDSSKSSGSECFPVVVVKNCGPELPYILAELFNMSLKEFCFPDCWKVSLVVHVFKNFGERSIAKNYRTGSLLSVVS